MGRGRYFPWRLKSTVWLECYRPSDGLPYGKFAGRGGRRGAEMRKGAAPCSRPSRDREGADRGTECPS